MFKKIFVIMLCFVSSVMMFGCQIVKPSVAKTPPLKIVSIPSLIENNELVISTIIYPKEKGAITGIDKLSFPSEVSVDIVNDEYALLRTSYKNLGSSGEVKFIIDNKTISIEKFAFLENNSIETISMLKKLGMVAPSPVLSDSFKISLEEVIRQHTPLYFGEDGVRVIIKNNVTIIPSRHGFVNRGVMELPAIPKEISVLKDDFFCIDIEYFYNGKSFLIFTSDRSLRLDKILITFYDGNFILTDLKIDDDMGKG